MNNEHEAIVETVTDMMPKKKSTSRIYAVFLNASAGTGGTVKYVEAQTRTELLREMKEVGDPWELQAVFKGKRLVVKRSFNFS